MTAQYFDYETVAAAAGIAARKLARLRHSAAREFPGDAMMQELHLLRVCTAIRDGELDIAAALRAA